jgi:hypothetical protein
LIQVSVDDVKRTVRLGNEAAEQGRETLQRSLTEAKEKSRDGDQRDSS